MATELATRANGAAMSDDMEAIQAEERTAGDLYKRLSARMPTKKLDVPGRPKMDYVSVGLVITRLNAALGPDAWSFGVSERWRDDDFLCTRGTLSVQWPGGNISHHEDIGSAQIKHRKDGSPVEIGDDWKASLSDCLKRCATQVGVGLFLRNDGQIPDAHDDQLQRDRPAASSSAATASKPAVSVPAGVAQGEGEGGEDRQSVRRAASPPSQPTRAVFQSDNPQGSVEWMWDQWRGLTAVAQGAGVKYADPPEDIDAATLGRWMQKLEQRIAEAAPF